ncbi:hypothetical protein [Limosilactobacillus allomucosae]|uniref:hypothetical protein n=1 Tax=Limosilactobacillus allomucosae TaxID=3142938 RepID=UPI003264726C
MTDKDEMRKTVEEIWQEKIYNFDFSETGGNDDKIRIIDSGTDDAVAILMSKINFQSTDNLESQINDIVLDPSNWNLSVKALIANPVFSDLVALSFTSRVLTGDPLADESYADEGEYISQFRESLKRLNLNWMDYASQSIDSILLNDARYVLDHWSDDRDVSFLIEDCFEANDVLDYEQLNKDFYYRYCDMVRDRVKQVVCDLEFEGKRLSWDQQRKLATMLKTSVKAIVEGYLNK